MQADLVQRHSAAGSQPVVNASRLISAPGRQHHFARRAALTQCLEGLGNLFQRHCLSIHFARFDMARIECVDRSLEANQPVRTANCMPATSFVACLTAQYPGRHEERWPPSRHQTTSMPLTVRSAVLFVRRPLPSCIEARDGLSEFLPVVGQHLRLRFGPHCRLQVRGLHAAQQYSLRTAERVDTAPRKLGGEFQAGPINPIVGPDFPDKGARPVMVFHWIRPMEWTA